MARQLIQAVELLERVAERNANGCMLVYFDINHKGYSLLRCAGKMMTAHRLVYTAKHGTIPAGMHVLHTCDTRNCVNVDHLFLGTNRDNIEDKCRKDRSGKKLRIADVLTIRALAQSGVTQTELARRFAVAQTSISRAITGKRWAHVGGHNVSDDIGI